MIFFITSFFSISPMHVRWLLPCIVKNNSSVMGLILDQCNGKIKLITHYAVHLELITGAATRGVLRKKVF